MFGDDAKHIPLNSSAKICVVFHSLGLCYGKSNYHIIAAKLCVVFYSFGALLR